MAGLEGFTRLMSGAGSAEDVYGRRPVVPEFPSYSEALKEITQGNLAALPLLKTLGLRSTEAFSEMMEKAYPGITKLKELGTENIRSMLSGELPQSVQDILKTRSAEYGVGSGTGGSEFAGAKGLRDLGLETLRYTQAGLDSASRWMAQAQAQTFDFSKMFLGPQDAIRQAESRWSRDWLNEQVKAAPDPTAKGKMDAEMQWIGMILSVYSGGPGYKPTPNPTPQPSGPGGTTGNSGGSYFGDIDYSAVSTGSSVYGSVPVNNYGYGPTPEGTHWNTETNSSTFGPF